MQKILKMLSASDPTLTTGSEKYNPTYFACWVFLRIIFTFYLFYLIIKHKIKIKINIMSKVENGNTVKVHYTGTFENGEVFDSSVLRNEPITFTIGSKQVISGFEDALIGMGIGESKTVTLTPEQAYGNSVVELIQEIDRQYVPAEVKVGETLTTQTENGQMFNVIVKEVNENTVVLDGNHPMAGKTLVFELELVEIV